MVSLVGRRLRVLFLASWYPNEEFKLSGIFIKRHAEAISRYCDVAVLYVHQSRRGTAKRIEFSQENGIRVVKVFSNRPRVKNQTLLYLYLIIDYVINSFKGLKIIEEKFGLPDIIHLNVVMSMGVPAFIFGLIKNKKYVLTEHTGPFSFQLRTRLHRILVRMILNRAKIILPVSTSMEQQIRAFYNKALYKVIPNVVDTNKFYPLQDIKKKNDKKRILFVNRLTDNEKNVSGLLKGIKFLSGRRKDFDLQIIGDGKDREKLENLANDLCINRKYVFFQGTKSEGEVANLMRHSNFFVLSSNRETFSTVCVEALSSGLPVVSTLCGGPEDYVSKDVGMLIEPKNLRALVNALDFMLDNYMKYDPQKIHQYAKARFSYEVVGKQYLDTYLSVLKRQ